MISQIKKHWELILVGFLILPFTYFVYVYVTRDGLAVYDASGHVGLAWYLKNYLWPHFTGWNFLSLLGFDQGRFYPPLFHYLVASLNFFFELEIAAKIVVSLSLLTLPPAIYYFIASIFKDIRERILVSGLLILLLILLPGYLGADLKALFQVGLLPSFVSTPLVFAYLGSLLRLRKIGLFWPTLFLVLVVLTHLVAGFFAIIFLISVLAKEVVGRKPIKDYLLHFTSVILLTAFWWLPFILQSGQISSSVHLSSLGLPNIACLLVALTIFLYRSKKKRESVQIIAFCVILLSLLTATDYFVEKLLTGTYIFDRIYNFHLYRLQIYEFILTAVLVSYFPVTWLYTNLGKVKSRLYFLAFAPIIAGFLIFVLRSPVLVAKDQTKILNPDKITGRFLETFSRNRVYPFIYSAQTKLQITKNSPWAYGLFSDANQNGPFIGSLIRSFSPEDYSRAKTNLIEEKTIDTGRLKTALDLFGVEGLLYTNFFKQSRNNSLDLFVIAREEQNLAEVPKYKLTSIKANWSSRVREWWVEKGALNELLIKINKNEKALPQRTADSVEITVTRHNKNWSSFTLNSNSKLKQPILVKFSYSPNWRAYQNGKPIKIYQTSPNFMTVVASGQIAFKYEILWYQYLAGSVSFVSLLLLFVAKLLKKSKK